MSKKNNLEFTINLTRKQFIGLLKTVYLGNWMANAYRDGSPYDPKFQEYEDIEDYVFSLASQFGLDKYVEHQASDGEKYYPTRIFEETTDVGTLHEEYDQNTFWDELADVLGERDFFEKYSISEIESMTKEEYFTKLSECIGIYHDEFYKYGIERIHVLDLSKN